MKKVVPHFRHNLQIIWPKMNRDGHTDGFDAAKKVKLSGMNRTACR